MIELPKERRTTLSDGLIVRQASPADLTQILSLLSQMHDEESAVPSTPELQETYEEILASRSRALLVVADNDELLGILDLIVVPNLSRGGRPWAAIENIVVDSAHRRRGIGGALLDEAIEIAQEVGCYKVQLVSHSRRDAAHSLYRHASFNAPVLGYRRYIDPGL
jgi:ribosomal protein S18 acetylase RimI-like enzyme